MDTHTEYKSIININNKIIVTQLLIHASSYVAMILSGFDSLLTWSVTMN